MRNLDKPSRFFVVEGIRNMLLVRERTFKYEGTAKKIYMGYRDSIAFPLELRWIDHNHTYLYKSLK